MIRYIEMKYPCSSNPRATTGTEEEVVVVVVKIGIGTGVELGLQELEF